MKFWVNFVMGIVATLVALSGVLLYVASQPNVQISVVVGDQNEVKQTIDKPTITQAPASTPQPPATPELVANPAPAPNPVVQSTPAEPVRQAPIRVNHHAQPQEVVDEEYEEAGEAGEEYWEFTYGPECRIPCIGDIIEYDGRHFEVTAQNGRTVTAVEVEVY